MIQVACNFTNKNIIHNQNETVKKMTIITSYVPSNVDNADVRQNSDINHEMIYHKMRIISTTRTK